MIVAIHQPNYLPWLGYFSKMAACEVFVFLDDVQYTKNSYINRVQIDANGAPRWLTVPVSCRFGDAIGAVRICDAAWRRSHLSTLKTYYAGATGFAEVWAWLEAEFSGLAEPGSLAESNMALIQAIARRLDLRCEFRRSSTLPTNGATGDDRLIAILQQFGDVVTYISGRGGDKYQDAGKMAAAGIALTYNDFDQAPYDQGHDGFVRGVSVVDSLFRTGFERTAWSLASRSKQVGVRNS